jgi:hypothetical protein
VSGDDNVVVGEIKTLITFVVSGVSEENISDGLGCQSVSDFGREIRVADTIEHVQVLIVGGWGDSMEDEVWTGHANRFGGETVQ